MIGRLALTVALCFLPTMANAQSLLGLGLFRLGAKIDVLQDWASENKVALETSADFMGSSRASRDKATRILILVPNDEALYKSEPNANFVDGYKSIFINQYAVGDLTIRDLNLLFYQDSLVRVRAHMSDELKTALRAKYGEPTIKIDRKPITCIYKLTGAKETKEDFTSILTWPSDKGIATALGYEIISYDDKCQLIHNKASSVISISSKKETASYILENHRASQAYYKSQENMKLKNMKGSLNKL